MIKPVNNHILIKPLTRKSFVATQRETFEEIGEVISDNHPEVKPGTKVYFDSWLAAKYPTGEGSEFFWLVKWDDIRAIDETD